jgi:predicted dithiol-disulfide oxidoreductase (DUF899 family)
MTGRRIGTREEWLAARLELLAAEKELTPLGRNESGLWWRRHDEYDDA